MVKGEPYLQLLTSFDSTFSGIAPVIIPLEYDDSVETNTKFGQERNCIVLGRGSITKPVHVVIAARSNKDDKEIVSRQHARITLNKINKEIIYTIEDLASLNGLFVNKEKVSSKTLKSMYVML